MTLAAFRSQAVVLLLLIRCRLLLPLWDSVLCFVVRYFVFSNHLDGEERAGCFALFVFLMAHDCCVALPHDATVSSAVCNCGNC